MSARWSLAAAERLVCLALHAYPATYRERAGAGLVELFRDTARDELARSGRLGLARVTARTIANLLADAAAERRRVRADLRAHRGPGARGWRMDTWRQDVGYALRMLRRTPGFTFVVVVTVALGVGADTAIFAVVDAALLAPLPYPQAGRLVVTDNLAPAPFLRWRESSRAFEAMAPFRFAPLTLTGAGRPEQLDGLVVNANFLSVLRVSPALGRGVLPGDVQGGARAGRGSRRRRLGARLRPRPGRRRPAGHARRRACHRRGRDAARLRVSPLRRAESTCPRGTSSPSIPCARAPIRPACPTTTSR